MEKIFDYIKSSFSIYKRFFSKGLLIYSYDNFLSHIDYISEINEIDDSIIPMGYRHTNKIYYNKKLIYKIEEDIFNISRSGEVENRYTIISFHNRKKVYFYDLKAENVKSHISNFIRRGRISKLLNNA